MIRAPASSDRQAYRAISSGVPLKRISPSTNCGMPQFALATRMAEGSEAVARLTMQATSSEGPVPQLLPHAARWCLRCKAGEFRRRNAHHGAAIGIEAQGGDDRQAGDARAGDGRFGFFDGGHGFDPQQVGAAARQRRGLLGEGVARGVQAQGPKRFENLAGRPHASGNQHDAPGAIGFARARCGPPFRSAPQRGVPPCEASTDAGCRRSCSSE